MTLRAPVGDTALSPLPWPPDDTEESIVGSKLHQEAIWTLSFMLQRLAERRGEPWGVGTQLTLEGMTRCDGTVYRSMSDVLVMPRAFDKRRATLSLRDDGIPLLLMEIASPSTVGVDLDAKMDVYSRAGIREYLVFDPTGDELGHGEQVRAWRLSDASPQGRAAFVPWQPDASRRWHSESLDLWFTPSGVLLNVMDRGQRRVLSPLEESRAEAEARLISAEARIAGAEARIQREAEARAALEAQVQRLLAQRDTPDGEA